MFLSLKVSLLLFISSPLSVLAATQELTRLGRVRLYPLKGKFLMRHQKPPPPLYLLSTSPLSLACFCLSLVAPSSFFSLFRLKPLAKQSCYFGPDKPSRCPSFPPVLYTTINPFILHPYLPPSYVFQTPYS